jgi:gas vesicle protein
MRGWKKLWDGYGYYLKPYKTEVAERAVKNDVMADFYAKQGVFAPKLSKELTDKFNEQAKQIEELKKTVAEQQKTIDTLKKNPPEHPGIH